MHPLVAPGNDLANADRSAGVIRWIHDYQPYLELCAAAAAAAECGLEPEDVEYALFRAA